MTEAVAGRTVTVYALAIALVAFVVADLVIAVTNDFAVEAGASDVDRARRDVLRGTPGVFTILAVMGGSFLAHHVLCTCIAPVVDEAGIASQVQWGLGFGGGATWFLTAGSRAPDPVPSQR
ncbi:hypothetical protein [Kineococcus sp. R86509]|uniref:hypothetical protein n=1 Tax=Kineococcus sp. R86509 TaxID=3093851 RepID=UPI0036D354A9